ncbi:MAG: hypothetical protein IKL72_07085 [Firmicutes bacterium]|nr:hypothetical protein [Bacillota bacterium]
MMNRKNASPIPMTGGSFIIVIFAVLCMTVFALLSLNTALADKRLKDASLKGTEAYYAADCRAEEIFADIRLGKIPEEVKEENGVYSFSCYVSDTQSLEVEIVREEEGFRVIRWQTVTFVEYEEKGPELWDGEDIM